MDMSELLARYLESMDDLYKSITGYPVSTTTRVKSAFSTSVESDEELEEHFNFLPLSVVSIERPRYVPNQFHDFIVGRVIPYFNCQRKANHRQFAVVLLLSESDLINIKQTRFVPSNVFGRPVVNNSFYLMPQEQSNYGNYLVARPSNRYHSEVKLFGQYSVIDSPFYHLWRAYVECNGAYPKCILIYSWNLPCNECTDVMVRSLGEKPYNSVSVVVAHSAVWSKETVQDHERSREKFKSKNITVEQVQYPKHLQHVPSSM